MNTPIIDPDEVEAALRDCLYHDDEIPAGDPVPIPNGAVLVEGIMLKVGLHPGRLESHRQQVKGWLEALPTEFRADGGGGWSFLNACFQKDGLQWTGFHRTMDALFILGIGLGYARFQLPRAFWSSLPGGMPYIVLTLEEAG